jgi:hypothetical protein
MTPKLMRNTKTGKVVLFHAAVIKDMPWYEPIDELEEKPKKKRHLSWKKALESKALDETPSNEA